MHAGAACFTGLWHLGGSQAVRGVHTGRIAEPVARCVYTGAACPGGGREGYQTTLPPFVREVGEAHDDHQHLLYLQQVQHTEGLHH